LLNYGDEMVRFPRVGAWAPVVRTARLLYQVAPPAIRVARSRLRLRSTWTHRTERI